MPVYDYECRECEQQFEAHLKMAERALPTETPCTECGGEIFQVFLKMNVGDSIRLGITKPDGAFQETLAKIHENTVGSKLNEKLSRNPSKKTTI